MAQVAMVAEAAHKNGKAVVESLADEGLWVAVASVAHMKKRAKLVRDRGSRGHAVRLNPNDALSAQIALAEVERKLGPIDFLVHVAPDHLPDLPGEFDPCTEQVVASMGERGGGAVVYLLAPGDPFPKVPAATALEGGVRVFGLQLEASSTSKQAAQALVALWRERATSTPVRSIGEILRSL